jgi:hypothetical protein
MQELRVSVQLSLGARRMTPDRFIAAAFREWSHRLIHKTPEQCQEAIEYGDMVRDFVNERAAELARQGADDEALPALPVPEWPAQEEWVDGLTTYPAQEDDLYTAEQMRAYAHDAITAWNTRTPAATVAGDDARDAARYRWLVKNHLDRWEDTKTGAVASCSFSFEAKGTWEINAAIDAAMRDIPAPPAGEE